MNRSGSERVCVVTVDETGDSPESASEVVAAHTSGGNGNILFGVPSTMSQAMEHKDAEYWKAAILDEITNHEEIFHVFEPPKTQRQQGMKVTPTRFLFLKNWSAWKRVIKACDLERTNKVQHSRTMNVSGHDFCLSTTSY